MKHTVSILFDRKYKNGKANSSEALPSQYSMARLVRFERTTNGLEVRCDGFVYDWLWLKIIDSRRVFQFKSLIVIAVFGVSLRIINPKINPNATPYKLPQTSYYLFTSIV